MGWELTFHVLSKAVDIVGLVGVADPVGSHTREFVLVSVAAFPWGVDGVPVGGWFRTRAGLAQEREDWGHGWWVA